MEYYRKQAKALVRAFRAEDLPAVRRADAVLGGRAQERFALSDAQHVVAREHGFRTWQDLRHALESLPVWIDGEDVTVATGLLYAPSEPVEVVVRKRGWRFDVSDAGTAVELAGRPHGWATVAGRVAHAFAINVNRRGVVFVQSNEGRLESLIARVAECSAALYEELLDHEH